MCVTSKHTNWAGMYLVCYCG